MAGFLTRSPFIDRLPTHLYEQWQQDLPEFTELTATGIVPDLHRIPFY